MAEYIEREATLHSMKCDIRPPFAVVRDMPAADVVEIPRSGIGDLSDGYHTFNELYHHRAVLFSVICNLFKDKAWKSKKHDTGDMYDGMFIVGIETPQGQATYHYDIDPYWEMFNVKELPNAPKWDGHTPEEAIRRISTMQVDNVIVPPCKVGDTVYCINTFFQSDPRITECEVDALHITSGKNIRGHRTPPYVLVRNKNMRSLSSRIYFEKFGITAFLTPKEAEKALAERQGSQCE